MSDSSPPESQSFRLIGWLAVALVAGALTYLLSPILTPFLFAAILAYICSPLVDRLEQLKVPRTLGVLLVMIGLAASFVLLVLILVPLFGEQAASLMRRVASDLAALGARIAPWLQRFGIDIPLTTGEIAEAVTEHMPAPADIGASVLPAITTGGLALIGFITNLVLVPVVLFYILRDWNHIVARIDESIPRRLHSQLTSVVGEMDSMLGQFLRGQVAVMVLLGAFYAVGLSLAGLQFALSIGVISGLLTFIPYVGAIIGFVLATLAGLAQFESMTGLLPVWGIFFVGQLLEGFVITPWLVGGRIRLHPVLVIFALLAFGELFGFFGMLIALPASAVLVVAFRRLREEYVESDLYSVRAEGIVLDTDIGAAGQDKQVAEKARET
jgi:predicted PurR-regulated permease PerM